LLGDLEGKVPHGKPRRVWGDDIETDLKNTGCENMDWIHLAPHRDRWCSLVDMIMNLWVSIKSGYFFGYLSVL
jgi:hypothetical protein